MFLEDYNKTELVYHVVAITDLKSALSGGIRFDDKATYKNKYYDFHCLIDSFRTPEIPVWVERKKAIFATMNYKDYFSFHSHTAILGLKIDKKKCWVANENRVNQLYEPFILKESEIFKDARRYVDTEGHNLIKEYWSTSLSFEDNLIKRKDLKEGYDAEVLIFHEVFPENMELLYLISDHRVLTCREWKNTFCL